MPSKRIKKPIRRKKKSDYPGEMSFRKALGMNPTYYQYGGKKLQPWEYLDKEGSLHTDVDLLPNDPQAAKKYAEELNWMRNWIPNRQPQMQSAIKSYMGRMDDKHPVDALAREYIFSPLFGEPSAYGLSNDWGTTNQELGKNILNNAIKNVNTLKFKDSSKVNPESYVPSAWGTYSPYNHSIYFLGQNPGGDTKIHEIGHGTRLAKEKVFQDVIQHNLKKDPIYKSNYNDSFHSPEEIYSRIWEIRKGLNLKPTDKVTKELLKKKLNENKNSEEYIDLFKYLKPDTIVNLLNELVYQEPSSYKQIAQEGGKLYYQEDIGELPTVKYGTPEYEQAYNQGTLTTRLSGDPEDFVRARTLPEFKVTPQYTSLSDDLRYLALEGSKGLAELTGVPGTVRFARNPVQSLKGAGNTLVDLGMTIAPFARMNPAGGMQYATQGINPLTGEGSFRAEDVEGAFNTLDAVGTATVLGSALKAPVTAGMKQAVNTIPKGVVDYGKDLAYSIPRGKLPQYANAIRWQPDEIPGFLKVSNLNLTDEQKALKGSWFGYDPATFNRSLANPNQKTNVLAGLGFYPQTRPGPGNILVKRLSERQIRNLEKSMSPAAKGMSGKPKSVTVSDYYLKGELNLPPEIRDNPNMNIRFDVNPSEYLSPNYSNRSFSTLSPPEKILFREEVGEGISNIINSNYQPIKFAGISVPRKYFPYENGGNLFEANQLTNQQQMRRQGGKLYYQEDFGLLPGSINNNFNLRDYLNLKTQKLFMPYTPTSQEKGGVDSYSTLTNNFKQGVRNQENGIRAGWNETEKKWYPHKSVEGGSPTIAYGHKLKPGESFSKGLSDKEALALFEKDFAEHEKIAKEIINEKYKKDVYSTLPRAKQLLLTDYAFNGVLKKFPSFTEALVNDDYDGMVKEYMRYSNNAPLKARNKWTKEFIDSNFSPKKQQKGLVINRQKFARGGSLTSAQDTAQAVDLNKDVMRKDIKKASAFEDFMAFNYGVGAGFLDTISFGATDELTDAGFKALQSAAGHDVNSEEAKRQAGLKGWGNIGGAVGGAFLNPGAMGSAIEEGTEGLGQGIKGIDPNSPTATGIGTALEGMGSTKAFTGLNDKDKIPEGMEGFSKIFMARNGGRFRYGYQGGGHMLNQNMGLTEIDGPSHEEGGVTLPNNGGRPDVEVEGPETIYTPENYVMSEKMKASLEALEFAGITGKAAKRLAGKSYADLSKMIKSKAGDKLRPNDPLSKKMLDKEMKKLMMAHEYDREAKRMQEEAMRSQIMGGSNIIAETPEERAGGYNMYPNAQSIAFPGSGPTSVVPTYNNDPIMVTGADGSQQMLTDEPIETEAPFIEEKMAQGGKMIKRADGSYSRRGLWDNIRANRGSGKKPTKQMLEQEAKIKAKMKEGGKLYYQEEYGKLPFNPNPLTGQYSWEQKPIKKTNYGKSYTAPEESTRVNKDIYGKNSLVNSGLYYTDKPSNPFSPYIHSFLDYAGLVPGFGEPFDALNALLYEYEGDRENALISGSATLPYAGMYGPMNRQYKNLINIGAQESVQEGLRDRKRYKEGGSFDNPGFRALPGYVQAKIKSNSAYGGQMFQDGGMVSKDKALKEYNDFKAYVEKARQAIGTNDTKTLKELGLRGMYDEDDLARDFGELQRLRKQAGLGVIEEGKILFPHVGQQMRGTVNQWLGTNFEVGGYMGDYIGDDDTMEYGEGGYTVRRSNDRKGKTHVVIGPDGTKKYFGDPKLGERGKSKYGKKGFYARHKKNLAKNPYFRAYARATWEDGGYMDMLNANVDIPDMEAPMYAYGGPMMYAQGGIHIAPSKRGTFKAQASKMGMGVQEAARTILNAPEGKYSPAMRKKANFARNFAKEYGGYYQMGGEMMQAPQQGQPQGGGEEQILQQVAQMLQQGMSPEEIVGQLVQMGVPQEQAIQIVQMVVQQMQGQQQAPQQAPPMMRGGGYMYQMGGEMAPQQQAQGGAEQIVQAIMQMLQQGMQPEEIVAQLVQMGLPQEAAIQAVQMVMQQSQQGQQQQPQPPYEQGMMGSGQPPMRYGGRYNPLMRRNGGKLYYQDGDVLPGSKYPSWYNQILNYESTQGSSQGTGLPNYGINQSKYAGKYPDMWADNKITEDEALEFLSKEYQPLVEGYPEEVQKRLMDYAYNTGRSVEDLLLYTGGVRSLEDIQNKPYDANLWSISKDAIIRGMNEPGYTDLLDQAKREVYKNTWTTKGTPDVYQKTSLPRINMWSNTQSSTGQRPPSQPVVNTTSTASPTAPRTGVPLTPTDIALRNFNRPRPQVSATPTGSEEDKTETGPGKDERYIPWKSNYAPIVAGGLAASAAPLANIVTSFTAEDTRAAAPLKFERPGYEPVALARQAGNQALGTYRSALRAGSPTAGAYLSNLAVTAPSMGVNVGKQVAEQRANIETRRAQIQGQEQMYNDRIRQFNILNQAKDEAARNQLRMQGAAGLGEIGQGVITDVAKTRGQEEILRALETKDFSPFKFERDARGRWRQVLSPRGAEYYLNSKGTNKVVTDSEGNEYEVLPNGTIRKMQ